VLDGDREDVAARTGAVTRAVALRDLDNPLDFDAHAEAPITVASASSGNRRGSALAAETSIEWMVIGCSFLAIGPPTSA